MTGHKTSVEALSHSPDGKYLASGSLDKTIKIWDTSTWKEVKELNGHTLSVSSLSHSPDGKYLISGSLDRTIKIWTGLNYKSINSKFKPQYQINQEKLEAENCKKRAELCNGLDDDCDGKTDENVNLPKLGVCKKSTFHACNAIKGWKPLDIDSYQSIETNKSDNLDNDCDGKVDEG